MHSGLYERVQSELTKAGTTNIKIKEVELRDGNTLQRVMRLDDGELIVSVVFDSNATIKMALFPH